LLINCKGFFGATEFPEAVWELQLVSDLLNANTPMSIRPKILNPKENADLSPREILFQETRGFKLSLEPLDIGLSVSRAKVRLKGDEPRKQPYFACCYDVATLKNVNIVAFIYSLLADWEVMDRQPENYRRRIRAAFREEMIHAVQVIAARNRFENTPELHDRFTDTEAYYESLLGRIIEELAVSEEGHEAVLTAARLYYEDWTITNMEDLRQVDRNRHGRDGYMVSELVRQLIQIRFGELLSEEAKGKAWDKNRLFSLGEFGTTENLLNSMAGTLRTAVPKLVSLSPTLAEALEEIEGMIRRMHQMDPTK
jgi:hypothetical protein